MIKHVFTGNLNANIDSCPPFPGKERHLLRAQLARIVHATSIIPKGLQEIDPDSNEIKFSAEFAMPGTNELQSMETWTRAHPILLKAGRCTHAVPAHIGEEEKEEYMAKLEENDKTVERFSTGLNEDVPIPGLETAWISKIVGDTQSYKGAPGKEGDITYAVNVIKSLRWPGALTVCKGGKFT